MINKAATVSSTLWLLIRQWLGCPAASLSCKQALATPAPQLVIQLQLYRADEPAGFPIEFGSPARTSYPDAPHGWKRARGDLGLESPCLRCPIGCLARGRHCTPYNLGGH